MLRGRIKNKDEKNMTLAEKIFGTHSSRELKRIEPLVDKIEALRPTMQALSDEELKGKTEEYKKRLSGKAYAFLETI